VSWSLVDESEGGFGQQDGEWAILPRTEKDTRGSAPFDEAAIDQWLKEIEALAGPDGRFWLVYTRQFHGDSGGLLLDNLMQRGLIEREREFAGAVLYRGQIKLRRRQTPD